MDEATPLDRSTTRTPLNRSTTRTPLNRSTTQRRWIDGRAFEAVYDGRDWQRRIRARGQSFSIQ